MFCWQYVDIDPVAVEDIKQRVRMAMPQNSYFAQPLQLDIKEFLGLEIDTVILITVLPFEKTALHTDDRGAQEVLALQIPFENCTYSVTEMWNLPAETHVESLTTKIGRKWNKYNKINGQKITEFRLTGPLIFRTDVPHCVNNYSPNMRKAISVRFKKDPWNLVNE